MDRAVEGAGSTILAGRAVSADPGEASAAAAGFLEGLNAFGVAGCLKHFPGLGRAAVDSHLVLPRIAEDAGELENDLGPFRSLAPRVPAVMVSHGAIGSARRPATLDRSVATGLLRGVVGFSGVAVSDDLEMGALAEFGAIADRAVLAFDAGCDLLCVGKDTAALPDAAEAIERGAPASRRREAEGRIGAFRESLRDLARRRRSSPRPVPVIAEAFREASARLS